MARTIDRRQWRRSSRCSNGACVEIAVSGDRFYVRDAHGTVLTLSTRQGEAFLAAVRDGKLS